MLFRSVQDEYSVEKLNELGISGFFKKNASFEELSNMLDITLKMHKKLDKGGEGS